MSQVAKLRARLAQLHTEASGCTFSGAALHVHTQQIRSVLQCVVVCCSVLQRVAPFPTLLFMCTRNKSGLCCSVLQCIAVCCIFSDAALHVHTRQSSSVLQCVAARCTFSNASLHVQCVAACCSVLQCVTVRCSVWHLFRRCSPCAHATT